VSLPLSAPLTFEGSIKAARAVFDRLHNPQHLRRRLLLLLLLLGAAVAAFAVAAAAVSSVTIVVDQEGFSLQGGQVQVCWWRGMALLSVVGVMNAGCVEWVSTLQGCDNTHNIQ
jgi:uncharacterized BrkB/YihY/UPF0761 family membrane protein